jgi:hypothetical protein
VQRVFYLEGKLGRENTDDNVFRKGCCIYRAFQKSLYNFEKIYFHIVGAHMIMGFGFDDWVYWQFSTFPNNYDSSQSMTVYGESEYGAAY